MTLTLTADTPAVLDSGQVGINIYQGTALLASAEQSGPLSATAIFTSSCDRPIAVQVFDYASSGSVAYTLTAQH